MFRDQYGIIPGILSVLVHVLLFGGLFVVFDFSSPVQPAMPMAIEATLVTEEEVSPPPPPPPEPEPEPAPAPEPPPPDTGDVERRRLEEEKRLADLRAEQERIRLQQEEDRRRREAEEAERRRRQEEETERLRAEAERQRFTRWSVVHLRVVVGNKEAAGRASPMMSADVDFIPMIGRK